MIEQIFSIKLMSDFEGNRIANQFGKCTVIEPNFCSKLQNNKESLKLG